jgi:exopolysaccharide biosynthesis WecB/TagA/CpsF family protein
LNEPRLSPPSASNTVNVGGFDTICATRKQLAEIMVADCLAARATSRSLPKLIFSSNGQGISLAGSDPAFAAAMSQADIIHADGMSVVVGSRIFAGRSIPERSATTDFFHDAALAAEKAKLSFFMLGGKEEQNAAACKAIADLYPGVEIVGRRNGYFEETDEGEICREIVASGADVLWVALGKPKQELWSARNRERLRGVGWVKTCGGLYAFLTGEVARAPGWAQKAGLEWLYRTLQEPRRLGWRYLVTNPHSLYLMARYSGTKNSAHR